MLSFLEFLALGSIGAAVVGVVTHLLKQPSVVGYILLGVAAGPYLFTHVDPKFLEDASVIGIALLLFLVGTELNLSKIRRLGRESLVLGAGQVVATTVLGLVLGLAFGFLPTHALVLAFAISLSSTVLVVKLLEEQNALDSLVGRLTLGILIVQDLISIVALIALQAKDFNNLILAGVFLGGLTWLSLLIAPRAFAALRKSHEASFFLSLAWLFVFILAGKAFNLGPEIPAILAGISLAGTIQVLEVARRLRPLKDLFLLFFFVSLGGGLVLGAVPILPTIALTLFVLIGNTLLVYWLCNLLGYESRTSFLVGLGIAQVSEFSFIIGAIAKQFGYLRPDEFAILGAVGLATFFFSSYAVHYGPQLYARLRRPLRALRLRRDDSESELAEPLTGHIILVGFHRMGYILAKHLHRHGEAVLVIESDPELMHLLNREGFPHSFGDVVDSEVLAEANLPQAKLLISTVPHETESAFLIAEAKRHRVPVVVTALNAHDAIELYAQGADYVIIPHFLGGERSAELIASLLPDSQFGAVREAHLAELRERAELGHF